MDRHSRSRNRKVNYHDHGLEKYSVFFEHCTKPETKVVLEATPEYLYQKTALESLKKLSPVPAIIFILRNPADRLFSLYCYLTNNVGQLSRELMFSDFIGMFVSDLSAYEKFIGEEVDRKALNLRLNFPNPIDRSRYIDYLPEWVESYPSVAIFLYEDLRDHTVEFMETLSGKIGIDALFWKNYTFPVKNQSVQIRNQGINKLVHILAPYFPKFIKNALKPFYAFNTKDMDKQTIISDVDFKVLRYLDHEFSAFNDQLARFLRRDLRIWQRDD